MKSFYKKIIYSIAIVLLLSTWSCQDYLDNPEDVVVTEEEIYQDFNKFQGFVEYMYAFIIDYNRFALTTTNNIGGEVFGNEGMTWTSQNRAVNGTYYLWISDDDVDYGAMQSNFYNDAINDPLTNRGDGDGEFTGDWPDSWQAIRISNKAIENIGLLTDATQDEKDVILGQAYFFRAFFHWILMKSWGGMPYIDKVLTDADNPADLVRITPQEMVDLMAADLDEAANYLPTDWDSHPVGQYTAGANLGRVTKSSAKALKAKALLYAASPLFNGFSGNSFTYNSDYIERAAVAAGEFLAQYESQHPLEPWGPNGETYAHMFASNDGVLPWSDEFIIAKNVGMGGSGLFSGRIARAISPNRGVWGGGTNGNTEGLNQLYADKFEMSDGTIYQPGRASEGGYDDDPTKRWENRDPRFRRNVYVNGDTAGFDATLVFQVYDGGRDRTWSDGAAQLTPYVHKKFWPRGVNNVDRDFASFNLTTPRLRMAEMYLIYAEAVTVAYSDPTRTAGGCSFNAVEAVNKVRRRANMPDVTAAATGYALKSYDAAAAGLPNFLALVRNEMWVELCFEGLNWYNMRRWYLMHYSESKQLVDLQFDENFTYVNRVTRNTMVFDNPKHYWLPIHRDDAQMFEGFGQNPGWE